MSQHQNNGNCPACEDLFNRYPGFNDYLKLWFKSLQADHPEAHISCAGRGKEDQLKAFQKGLSRAIFGESSHNYNCALDLFALLPGTQELYPRNWFNTVVAPRLTPFLKWYGAPGAKFFELPHVEIADWRELKERGIIKDVENQNEHS